MREQPIDRVVDAMRTQQRVIVWLHCGHKISLSDKDLHAHPELHKEIMRGVWSCHFCPDPTPAMARESKSARQLYFEAGEP